MTTSQQRSRHGVPSTEGAIDRPDLFARLEAGRSEPVTAVVAPAGSGKTYLVASWLQASGHPAAWTAVERHEQDPQKFWQTVITAIDVVSPRLALPARFAPSPHFDGSETVAALAAALGELNEQLILVIDDLHELRTPAARTQLAEFLAEKPAALHVILCTRQDPRLGLHRSRLARHLIELRAEDLRFSAEDAREVLAGTAVTVSDDALRLLHDKTEGWPAGVRLAAIALSTGRFDPEQFLAEFSGSERTVAEYLVAEMIDTQPDDVREFLLRTSVCDRISGSLADALTDRAGGLGTLQELERAGVLLYAIDQGRTWFRYHHLLSDLLRLQLQLRHPEDIRRLHRVASAWFADHAAPAEAIAHAQAAGDWDAAVGLLAENYFSLVLDGMQASARALLGSFPDNVLPRNPELAAVRACDDTAAGALDRAGANIAVAEGNASAVSAEGRPRYDALLTVARLTLARQQSNSELIQRQLARSSGKSLPTSHFDLKLNVDLRLVGLMNLGIVEAWSGQSEAGADHLEQAAILAHQNSRPYIEISCRSHMAATSTRISFVHAADTCREAIAAAEAAGWGSDPVISPALVKLATCLAQTGSFEAAVRCLDRVERVESLDPPVAFVAAAVRAAIHQARGEDAVALEIYQRAERIREVLAVDPPLGLQIRCATVDVLIRLGRLDDARAHIARLTAEEAKTGEGRGSLARLALAQADPAGALKILEPTLAGTAPVHHTAVVVRTHLLAARALSMLGDVGGVRTALEQALDLAEPDRLVLPFALTDSGQLLREHPGHLTRHGALIAEILDVLRGGAPMGGQATSQAAPDLSAAELRVLRLLPSHLSGPEIAHELFVSLNTVKSHLRQIYAKLDAHGRTEAVARARELGLLAPSARRG